MPHTFSRSGSKSAQYRFRGSTVTSGPCASASSSSPPLLSLADVAIDRLRDTVHCPKGIGSPALSESSSPPSLSLAGVTIFLRWTAAASLSLPAVVRLMSDGRQQGVKHDRTLCSHRHGNHCPFRDDRTHVRSGEDPGGSSTDPSVATVHGSLRGRRRHLTDPPPTTPIQLTHHMRC